MADVHQPEDATKPLRKIGNSFGVILPKEFLEFTDLHFGNELQLSVEGEQIVIGKKTKQGGSQELRELWLEEITVDLSFHIREIVSEEKVEEYRELLEQGDLPPIEVFQVGEQLLVVDGFLRLEATRRAKRDSIQAKVFQGDRRAALLHALRSNATHGLPRTQADKRKAISVLLLDPEWSRWSDRHIAKLLGVSHPLVGTVRAELSGKGYQMPEHRQVARGGTVYQMRPRIAAKQEDGSSSRQDALDEQDWIEHIEREVVNYLRDLGATLHSKSQKNELDKIATVLFQHPEVLPYLYDILEEYETKLSLIRQKVSSVRSQIEKKKLG